MSKPKTDVALLKRLKKTAPHVLEAKVDFDAIITKALAANPGDVDRHMERLRADAKTKSKAGPKPK